MPFPSPMSLPQQPDGGGGMDRGGIRSAEEVIRNSANPPFSLLRQRLRTQTTPLLPSPQNYGADYREQESDFFGLSQMQGGPADVYPGKKINYGREWPKAITSTGPPRMHHEMPWPSGAPKSFPGNRYLPAEKWEEHLKKARTRIGMPPDRDYLGRPTT